MDTKEEKPKEIPKELVPNPPLINKKWLKKRTITFLGNTMPSLVAMAAIWFAWGQTKETNKFNFEMKKQELIFQVKRQVYVEFVSCCHDMQEYFTEIKHGDTSYHKKFDTRYKEFQNNQHELLIFLDSNNSATFNETCLAFRMTFSGSPNWDYYPQYERSMNYFYGPLKEQLFKTYLN
jgi:hypothetical protein